MGNSHQRVSKRSSRARDSAGDLALSQVERQGPDGALGEWLAYTSDSGVYVRPYPGPKPATLIADGGTSPAWSPDGKQIYYDRDGVLLGVDVTPGDEFQARRPATLIDPWILGTVEVRN